MDKMDEKQNSLFSKIFANHCNFVKPNDNYAGWVGQRGDGT